MKRTNFIGRIEEFSLISGGVAMNRIGRFWLSCGAVLALLAAACGSGQRTGDSESEAVRSPIANMAELEQRLAELDVRLNANFDDPDVQQQLAFVRGEADRINGIVATIEVEPGHLVRFYSPGEGVTVVSESHRDSQNPLLSERSIPPGGLAALHESLRPGEPVPQALLDLDRNAAQDPALNQTSNTPVAVQGEVGGGQALETVQKHGTSSCSHFLNHGGCPAGESGDFPYCTCNWGGGGYATASAVTSYQRLALFGGASVTARGKIGSNTIYADAVVTGEFRSWFMESGGGFGDDEWCGGCGIFEACPYFDFCRKTHRFDILNASGDQFHFGGFMDYSSF